MALWIQYLRLAVLLILLTTQARSTPHLRGSQLADALYMVCRETGFYQPKVGRDLEQPLVNGAQGSEMDGMQDYPIIKGGIVERCCYGACSYYDLLKYCN